MTWKDETGIEKVNDLFIRLLGLDVREPVACRGQPDISRPLLSSLDRVLPHDMAYEDRLAEETAIIVKFCCLAKEFCDDIEKGYLQGPMPQDRIKALPILQHHGAPTRLLDWTRLPLVALYFASISEHDKDGAVWWFSQKAFYDKVDCKWKEYGLKRYVALNNGVNLNDTAFETNGPPWITELHCSVPFDRIKVQQGFFTIAGRLGLDHGELIADVLDEGQYARVIVPISWKQEILDQLRNRNIHSKSIDYPGADLVGTDLTRDLKRAQHRGNLDCSATEFGSSFDVTQSRGLISMPLRR
jgi:hypothetical protein